MLRCSVCARDVVVFGIARFPGADAAATEVRAEAERQGRLVLFNPPPFGPRRCPRCDAPLTDTAPEEGAAGGP